MHTSNGCGYCDCHNHGGGNAPPPQPADIEQDDAAPAPKDWRRGGRLNRKINRNRRRR